MFGGGSWKRRVLRLRVPRGGRRHGLLRIPVSAREIAGRAPAANNQRQYKRILDDFSFFLPVGLAGGLPRKPVPYTRGTQNTIL